MAKPDMLIDDNGTIFMFTPITALGREWVDEHLSLEGWQWMGLSFAVEHRFAAGLAQGMKADGLRVA